MNELLRLIRRACTTRYLRGQLANTGLCAPAQLEAMLLTESNLYIAAAIVAVNQLGE